MEGDREEEREGEGVAGILLSAFGIPSAGSSPLALVVLVGATLAFFGSLGPWYGESTAGISQRTYGFDIDEGRLLLLTAAIAFYATLRFLDRREARALLLVFAIGIATTVIGIFDLNRASNAPDVGAGVARETTGAHWGLYLLIAGGVVLALGAFLQAVTDGPKSAGDR